MQGSGDIDVYVISGEREEGAAAVPVRRPALPTDWPAYAAGRRRRRSGDRVAFGLFPFSELSNLVMVYLLGIVIVAMRTGRGPSLLAAVLSVAAFDFFFVPPRFTFAVTDARYLFTFLVMLIVGLVISGLTVRTRAQAEAAHHREQQTAALYAMSRELAEHARGRRTCCRSPSGTSPMSSTARSSCWCPATAARLAAWTGGQFEVDANELGVARWVYEHRQPAGLGTTTLPGRLGAATCR